VGDVIEGKVVRMTNFGAFVELDEGIEGLIHVSEFDDAHGQEKIELGGGRDVPDEDHQAESPPSGRSGSASGRSSPTSTARTGSRTRRALAPARPRSAITSGTRASLRRAKDEDSRPSSCK
jgi:hypothetical protein